MELQKITSLINFEVKDFDELKEHFNKNKETVKEIYNEMTGWEFNSNLLQVKENIEAVKKEISSSHLSKVWNKLDWFEKIPDWQLALMFVVSAIDWKEILDEETESLIQPFIEFAYLNSNV